jgi:ribosomal protein L37AE/L43A
MNMRTNTCPCCGGSLLRHVRHGELYWFCQSCRQEVPLLTVVRTSNSRGETQTPAIPQTALTESA